MEAKNANIVEIIDVSFSYEDDEGQVLDGISFNIHSGDYLGIIGPNGAGKTTLLKLILGILKPKSGAIKLFGEDISTFKNWSRIGYVPQKATHFEKNFPATVREVVLMGRFGRRGLFRSTNNQDKKLVREALQKVGMWEFANRLIGDLSVGQQQRVFIARALVTEPEIIFLDEPTTGIDPQTQKDFYELLKKLNNELGLTLVLISHDVGMVTNEAKHVACIDKSLVCHGLISDFLKNNKLNEIFMGGVKIITHERHDH